METRDILAKLVRETPHLEFAAVVNHLGVLNDCYPQVEQGEAVSAVTAALYSLGTDALDQLSGGPLQEIYIRGEDRDLLVLRVTGKFLLFLTVAKGARLGVVLFHARKAISTLREKLQTPLLVGETVETWEVEEAEPPPSESPQPLREVDREEIMRFIDEFLKNHEDFSLQGLQNGEGEEKHDPEPEETGNPP